MSDIVERAREDALNSTIWPEEFMRQERMG